MKLFQGLPKWQFLTPQEWAAKSEEIQQLLPGIPRSSVDLIMENYGYTTDWAKQDTVAPPVSGRPGRPQGSKKLKYSTGDAF
jgi:hypothetical protein